MNSPRLPVFDTRLAQMVSLYNMQLLVYCRRYCFCPNSEDKYMAADFAEATSRFASPSQDVPETTPEVLPLVTPSPQPSTDRDPTWWFPWRRKSGNQKLPSYYDSTSQCTRTASQRLQCPCRPGRVGQGRIPPIRVPQRVAISPFV